MPRHTHICVLVLPFIRLCGFVTRVALSYLMGSMLSGCSVINCMSIIGPQLFHLVQFDISYVVCHFMHIVIYIYDIMICFIVCVYI